MINNSRSSNMVYQAYNLSPVKLLILIIPLITCNLGCSSDTEAVVGELEHLKSFNSAYIGSRQVDVWLPPDYPANAPYAVIYMHDGKNLFDASKTWNGQAWGVDQVLTKLMKEQKIKPCIVVSIWNAGRYRRAEYMPENAFNRLSGSMQDSLYGAEQKPNWPLFPKKVYSNQYLRFIVEELKPYIDDHYPVDPSRENTFIMGSSMGGLISMYAMLEYPDIFGGAGCLSTHWYGLNQDNQFMGTVFLGYLADNILPPGKNRWYFDYGTEGIDSCYEPYQIQADSILRSAGYTHKDWLSRKFDGHTHDENSWRSRLHIPMEFLLRN